MRCLIDSKNGSVNDILEKYGYNCLEIDNKFYIELENIEEIFYVSSVVGYDFIITGGLTNPSIIIDNIDYIYT